MKKSTQILQKIANAKKEMKAFLDSGKVEDAHAKIAEISNLEMELDVQLKIEQDEEKEESTNEPVALENSRGVVIVAGANDSAYKAAFFKAFKRKQLDASEKELLEVQGALSSSTGEDGGYLIPSDQRTAIKELKRALPSFELYVNVEPVVTLSGSRNIEKDALYTPFVEFAEGADVPASDAPQFVNVPYEIKDRGGILPVPNNLMNDSDAAVERYLNRWLARKSVATRNALILAKLNTLTKLPVVDLDDVKNILNLELDPAIEASSKIFTNQSGFNWLDTLKDLDDKYIVQPNPLEPMKKMLFGKYEIVVFSNKAMPNRTDGLNIKAPMVIGDLQEAITLFDREQMSLLSTNIGGDAFKKNRTDIRAIEREDVRLVDSEAVKFGEVIVEVTGG